MKTFFTLLKVNLRNFLIPNSGKKNKKTGKQKQKGIGGIIGFLVFMYVFMTIYAFSITMMGKSTVRDLGLAFGTCMGTLMTLIFTFTNAHAVLFKAKDFDLLMCLPIDTKTIIASKLVTVSVLGYVYFSFGYLPSLLFYLILIEFNLTALLFGLLVFICAPLLILTVSAFVSILLGLATQKMKHKNAITSIAYLVFTLAILGFSYSLGFSTGSNEDEFAAMLTLRNTLTSVNPLSSLMLNSIQGDFANMLFLIAISVIPFIMFLVICGNLYVRLNATSKDGYKNKNFKLKKEKKQGSQFKALIDREFKTFIGTPVYLTNVIISPIMGTVIIILGAVVGMKNLGGMLEGIDVEEIRSLAPMALVALSSWAFGISPATSVIINMEGKSFWLIKSLPVSEKKILWSKIVFNMLLYVPFILIGTITAVILVKPNFIDALCMILSPIAYSLCFSFVGLLLNTRFYNLDWDNATQAVKQGAGMVLAMLIDMGISGFLIAPFVIGIIFEISLSYVILIVGCLFALLFGLLLFTKGAKNYANITA